MKRQHTHQEIQRFYRTADLCLVTSLHDGMNLVAKEFVAARQDEQGVLILSRFTGAARELPDALLINPYDIEQMAEAIRTALEMDVEERKTRMQRMRRVVREHNIFRWASNLIAELCEVRLDEPANRLDSQLGRPSAEPSAHTILVDQSLDDLQHARPVTATGDNIGTLLEPRYGVGHGD
jgi:trehalose-6-phosphate synthase